MGRRGNNRTGYSLSPGILSVQPDAGAVFGKQTVERRDVAFLGNRQGDLEKLRHYEHVAHHRVSPDDVDHQALLPTIQRSNLAHLFADGAVQHRREINPAALPVMAFGEPTATAPTLCAPIKAATSLTTVRVGMQTISSLPAVDAGRASA